MVRIDESSDRGQHAAHAVGFVLALTFAPSADGRTAMISVQPVSQAPKVGATVTLSVTATGTAPLTYQWFVDGSDIDEATSTTLTLSNAQII